MQPTRRRVSTPNIGRWLAAGAAALVLSFGTASSGLAHGIDGGTHGADTGPHGADATLSDTETSESDAGGSNSGCSVPSRGEPAAPALGFAAVIAVFGVRRGFEGANDSNS